MMRRTILLLSVSALVLGTSALPSGAITFGEEDGDLHQQVGALIGEWEGELSIFCSGTLIAPDVFLTAAHCVMPYPGQGEDFWVTFATEVDLTNLGTPDDPNPSLLPGTASWHEEAWTGGRSDPYDIAVVVLDEPVTSITPAELPALGQLSEERKELRSEEFTTVGYGDTRDTQQGGWWSIEDLDGVRRYAMQSFQSLQKAWLVLDMNPATGNGGTCYGDSGGPHFLGDETSNLVVSITVTGDAWCKATDKTYRLDTPSARDFLAEFVTLPS